MSQFGWGFLDEEKVEHENCGWGGKKRRCGNATVAEESSSHDRGFSRQNSLALVSLSLYFNA